MTLKKFGLYRPENKIFPRFPKIRVLQTSFFEGPNRWSYRPTLEKVIDLGPLEDYPSTKIEGLADRLINLLPTLETHGCNYGVQGGFIKRLYEGTWAGHIIEHLAIELQNLSGIRGNFGRTRDADATGRYFLAFNSPNRIVGDAVFNAARDIFFEVTENIPLSLEKTLDNLKELAHKHCLGHGTQSLVDIAEINQVPHISFHNYNLVQFGYGVGARRIWSTETEKTSAIAEDISCSKQLSKDLLSSCGIPTPRGYCVKSEEDALEAAKSLGWPLCIKPLNANRGRGVVLNIKNHKDLLEAFSYARQYREEILIESFISGNSHRLLVVGNELVAASKDKGIYVVGNGKDAILQLIKNQIIQDPRRGAHEHYPLPAIKIDERLCLNLRSQDLSLESIPIEGKEVLVQLNHGENIDCISQVNSQTVDQALLAARIIGLDIAGIDLVAEDIRKPLDVQNGAIVEINARPSLVDHLLPKTNVQPVAQKIFHHLFNKKDPHFIPLIGICGSDPLPILSHFIGYMLSQEPNHFYTGVSTENKTFYNGHKNINFHKISEDCRSHILVNVLTQAAVIETTYKELALKGLPYTYSTLAILTKVVPKKHLARYHITNEDQLRDIFRTLLDVVVPFHGYSVLNYDDPFVRSMAEFCKGTVIFFSESSLLLPQQKSVWIENHHIFVNDSSFFKEVINILPYNLPKIFLLSSVAAAWALNFPLENFSQTLDKFLAEFKGKIP